jgi:hypothetical protein
MYNLPRRILLGSKSVHATSILSNSALHFPLTGISYVVKCMEGKNQDDSCSLQLAAFVMIIIIIVPLLFRVL